MPITFEEASPGIAVLKVDGKVTGPDYEAVMPRMEQLLATSGPLRALVDIVDFHGMTLEALWDDLKVAFRHHHDIGRLAVLGNRTWEAWLTKIPNPFLSGEVRYFDQSERRAAMAWLQEGIPAH